MLFDIVILITSSILVEVGTQVVTLKNGLTIHGKSIEFNDKRVESRIYNKIEEYLGIPYSEAPVGNKRFQQKLKAFDWKSQKTFNATKYCNVCPQQEGVFRMTAKNFQDEDCLCLNVYTVKSNVLNPVMVYIHGGSYLYGTGNRLNGTVLASLGVVFVSMNYRLGALGFMTSGDDRLLGNYGLYDQVMALEWVKENIASFGGNPNSVTIFGSSAGGSSVGLLYLSPYVRKKNIFQKVIAQSGTANAFWASHFETKMHLINRASKISAYLNCSLDDMACLKKVDWRNLIYDRICDNLKEVKCNVANPIFKPITGNEMFPVDIPELIRTAYKLPGNVPYITGTVRTEFGKNNTDSDDTKMSTGIDDFLNDYFHSFVPDIIRYEYVNWSVIGDFNDRHLYDRSSVISDLGLTAPTSAMAKELSKKRENRVFLYYVDRVGKSFHSVELNYVFGTPFTDQIVDERDERLNSTDYDIAFSNRFLKLWTDFARFQFPNKSLWPSLDPTKMNYLYLDSGTGELKNKLRYGGEKVAFWEGLIPFVDGKVKHLYKTRRSMAPETPRRDVYILAILCAILTLILLTTLFLIWKNKNKGKSNRNRIIEEKQRVTISTSDEAEDIL
ncbi:DgyrCDS1935 [Dimorphilus gyrociliatus]|uniref:Carboxylic ester hydrolase n=1 Tax=Dimorphilus gyrociliatus TaxID=2664684 RepID=A0A7I8VAR2_9ANNE|nr:DgyrCDS1935 [Dimorphilus gyrociliatus]